MPEHQPVSESLDDVSPFIPNFENDEEFAYEHDHDINMDNNVNQEPLDLRHQLADWMDTHGITRQAGSELLTILNQYHPLHYVKSMPIL